MRIFKKVIMVIALIIVCAYDVSAEYIDIDIENIQEIQLWGSERVFSYDTNNINEIKYLTNIINSFEVKPIEVGNFTTNVDFCYVTLIYADGTRKAVAIPITDKPYPSYYSISDLSQPWRNYEMTTNELCKLVGLIKGISDGKIDLKEHEPSFDMSLWAEKEIKAASDEGLLRKIHAVDYQLYISRTETASILAHCICNKNHMSDMILGSTKEGIAKLRGFGLLEICTVDTNFPDAYYDKNREYIMNDLAKPFEDAAYMPDVKLLYELGLINGKTDNGFYPYDNITREEFAKMLSGIYDLSLQLKAKNQEEAPENAFVDNYNISDWAKKSVNRMVDLKVLEGNDNNEFLPQEYITKEEVILALYRLNEIL